MKLRTSTVIVLAAFIQSSLTCFPFGPVTSPFTPSPSPSPSPSQPSATSSSSSSSSNHNNNQEVAYNLDCQCGAPSKNKNRIVGGQPAEKNEYPWQVAIKAKPNKKPFCGGSILSSKTILTAAHCNIYKAHETRVVVGDHDLYIKGDGEKNYLVESWVSHPRYNPRTTDYDYAIITLQKPIEFSFSALPVCLPSTELAGGEEAIVTGWGTTEYGSSHYPRILQEASVTVLNSEDCTGDDKLYSNSDITGRMVCASEPGKDACQGDSGGPLITMEGDHYALIGVTSWGIGCARSDAPGVYARVLEVKNWIENNMSGSTCNKTLN